MRTSAARYAIVGCVLLGLAGCQCGSWSPCGWWKGNTSTAATAPPVTKPSDMAAATPGAGAVTPGYGTTAPAYSSATPAYNTTVPAYNSTATAYAGQGYGAAPAYSQRPGQLYNGQFHCPRLHCAGQLRRHDSVLLSGHAGESVSEHAKLHGPGQSLSFDEPGTAIPPAGYTGTGYGAGAYGAAGNGAGGSTGATSPYVRAATGRLRRRHGEHNAVDRFTVPL